jgi:hypothetical protein
MLFVVVGVVAPGRRRSRGPLRNAVWELAGVDVLDRGAEQLADVEAIADVDP